MPKANVFPMFLDGALATFSTADGTLPVNTSYIVIDSADAISVTLPAGVQVGQLMTLLSKNGGQKTIAISSPLTADADSIIFNAVGQTALLMWNGTKWVVLMGEGAATLS